MKDLKNLLKKKVVGKHAPLDEKSVFYVFQLIMKDEYGRQGIENIKPVFYRDNKIFIRFSKSAWNEEIWLNKDHIIKRINDNLGMREIKDFQIYE